MVVSVLVLAYLRRHIADTTCSDTIGSPDEKLKLTPFPVTPTARHVTLANGTVTRDVDEPLTDHFGRGSAKQKT